MDGYTNKIARVDLGKGNISIQETMPIKVADPDRLDAVKERIRTKIQENGICDTLHLYGTSVLVNIIHENEILPTNNFQHGNFPQSQGCVRGEDEKQQMKNDCHAPFPETSLFGIHMAPEGENHSPQHRRTNLTCSDAQIYAHMSKIQ